jgi:hypothetical protein
MRLLELALRNQRGVQNVEMQALLMLFRAVETTGYIESRQVDSD